MKCEHSWTRYFCNRVSRNNGPLEPVMKSFSLCENCGDICHSEEGKIQLLTKGKEMKNDIMHTGKPPYPVPKKATPLPLASSKACTSSPKGQSAPMKSANAVMKKK